MRGPSAGKLYKSVFENARDGILIADGETGAILGCNRAFSRMSGWRKSELSGKERGKVLQVESRGRASARSCQAGEARGKSSGSWKLLVTKSGESRAVLVITKRIQLEGQTCLVDYLQADRDCQELDQLTEVGMTKILDGIAAGIYVADLETHEILYANEYLQAEFGHQLVGTTCYRALRGESAPCAQCRTDLLLKCGGSAGEKAWEDYNPVSGKWYANTDRLIRWHDGRLVRLRTAKDVTGRQRADQDLKTMMERYRDLVDHIHELVSIIDLEGNIQSVNQAVVDLTGYRMEEVVGQNLREFLVSGSLRDLERFLKVVGRRGRGSGTFKLRMKSGEIRLWQFEATLKKEADAQPVVRGYARDITERMQAEDALRKEKERAQHYLDIAGVILLALDLQGRVTLINRKGAEILGCDESEIIGKSWFEEFVPEEDRHQVWRTFRALLAEGESPHRQIAGYVRSKSGERFYINWHNSLLRDEQGIVIGTLSSGGDITHRKRMEDDLRRRADELAALQETVLGITSRHSLPELLESIVERAVKLLGGSAGGLYLVEPETRRVRCMVSHMTKKDYVGTALSYGEGAAGQIAETGQPLIVDDYRSWAGRASVFEDDQPFQVLIGTPLIWQGSVTGVLHVLRDDEARKFTPDDLVLLTLFADHAAIAVENARLYSTLTQQLSEQAETEMEVRRQMAELETLYETGLAISRELDSKSIGERIVASFAEKLDWHHAAIRLRRGESDRLELIAFNQPGLEANELPSVRKKFTSLVSKVGQGLSGYVIRTGETIRTGNVGDHPGYVETFPGIRSGLYVPLKVGGLVTGSIAVESELANAFGEHDQRLLETLAAHAAAAFENARLYQGLQQELAERKRAQKQLVAQTRELEALFSISTHLRSAQSVDEILPLVLDEMQRVLATDSNAVFLLNKGATGFTCALGRGALQACEGMDADASAGLLGEVYATGRPHHCQALAGDLGWDLAASEIRQLGPALFAPIVSDDEFLGVLVGARKRESATGGFNDREVRLLSAVGEMVGNALRRMRLIEEVLTRMQQVQALHSVDMAIASSIDAKTVLDVILGQAVAHLSADAAAVLLFQPETQILEYAALLGFRFQEIRKLQLWPGEGLAGEVVQGRQVYSVPDLEGLQNAQVRALSMEKLKSYHAVPMYLKGLVRGVLEIYYRQSTSLEKDQVEFLQALAAQAAIALDNAELFSNLQRSNLDLVLAYDATIEGWSQALDLREHDAEGHTRRLTELTLAVAREMGLQDELNQIRWGALLHDIGKIGLPDGILLKQGPLTEEETLIMREHPSTAYRLISPIVFLRPALDIPYCHHERWDGSGYPRGLAGTQIPLSARIFTVVDVWEALTSDRPFRKAWPVDQAIEYLRDQSGVQFDPQVVEVFLRLMQAENDGLSD